MRIALVGYGKVGQAIRRALRKNALFSRSLELAAVVDKRFGAEGGPEPPMGVPHVLAEDRRTHLPWREVRPDLVIDATGAATTRELAAEHLASGAPRVIVTQSMPDADATLIAGVNVLEDFDPLTHLIVSASSCTAVCFAPLANYLNIEFGIEKANVTILHGYDPENMEADIDRVRAEAGTVEKLRRGERASYRTNFVRNVEAVLPALAGKLSAGAFYANDGIVAADRALFFKGEFRFKKPTSAGEVNEYVRWLSSANLAGTLASVPALCRPGKVLSTLSLPAIFFPFITLVEGNTVTLFFGGNYIDGYAVKVLDLAFWMGIKEGKVVEI